MWVAYHTQRTITTVLAIFLAFYEEVAGAAVTLVPFAGPGPQPRRDRRVLHSYGGPQYHETPEEREARLLARAERLAERATLLVVAVAPGVGKSYSIAELGAPTTAHPLARAQCGLDR